MSIEERAEEYALKKCGSKNVSFTEIAERCRRVRYPITPYMYCKNDYRNGAIEQLELDYKEANDYMVSLLEIANEMWMEKTGKEMFDIETHSLQLQINMGFE